MKRILAAAALLSLLTLGCAQAEGTGVVAIQPIGSAVQETASPVTFTPQPTATPVVPASPASAQTVTIRRAGDVNVRREPRFNSERIGTAKAGRTYALVEIAESGWYKIRLLDGKEGYISPKLVQGDPEVHTEQRAIIRKSGNANVRETAEASSRRVGVARAGRSYPLLSVSENGWYKILLPGGVVGFVSPKMVNRVTEPGENPDATPAPAAEEPTQKVTIRRKGNVNVRQEPQFSSNKVGTAIAGRSYPLLETAENGWYKIRLENNVEGYISSKLAK